MQLAIVIPGQPRSANKAPNIESKAKLIKTYLKKQLYPLLEEACSKNQTSAAVCTICFSNAVLMFVNYSPTVNPRDLEERAQKQFLLDEKKTLHVELSRALQLKKVRCAGDCSQKVLKMKVVGKDCATFNDDDDGVELYIKTCSFKMILDLENDSASVTNRCDLDNAFTCAQNAYWDACSELFGWSAGTDARVRTIFGDPTSFSMFKDIRGRR